MAEKAEDLNLPLAVVSRIIKDALPDGVNVSREARVAISRAASVFVLYATSSATSFATAAKRKTLAAPDVIEAMKDLEFHEFVPSLEESLKAFRSQQQTKKTKHSSSGHDDNDVNPVQEISPSPAPRPAPPASSSTVPGTKKRGRPKKNLQKPSPVTDEPELKRPLSSDVEIIDGDDDDDDGVQKPPMHPRAESSDADLSRGPSRNSSSVISGDSEASIMEIPSGDRQELADSGAESDGGSGETGSGDDDDGDDAVKDGEPEVRCKTVISEGGLSDDDEPIELSDDDGD